ncbi:MAG: hypothetical protein ACYTGG_03475 [Planctomycetota bacterium]|jgi:hypothetical protein
MPDQPNTAIGHRWPFPRILGAAALFCLVVAAVAGCRGSAGSLRAESIGDRPVTLISRFKTACFSFRPEGETSFLLTDLADEELLEGAVENGQIMHVSLLWEPKPGSTPMDSAATNVAIRYVILSNGEMGIYEGGGFAIPSRPPRTGRVSLTVRDASIRLLDSTPGFVDQLTPARISGRFSASRDDERARLIRLAASQIATNSLGRTRFVRDSRPVEIAPDAMIARLDALCD